MSFHDFNFSFSSIRGTALDKTFMPVIASERVPIEGW